MSIFVDSQHRLIVRTTKSYCKVIWANTNTAAAVRELVSKELSSIRDAGTWKSERIITGKQSSHISVQGRKSEVLNFCANNYLGLAVRTCYL